MLDEVEVFLGRNEGDEPASLSINDGGVLVVLVERAFDVFRYRVKTTKPSMSPLKRKTD